MVGERRCRRHCRRNSKVAGPCRGLHCTSYYGQHLYFRLVMQDQCHALVKSQDRDLGHYVSKM